MKRIIFSFFLTLFTSLAIAQGWQKSYTPTCPGSPCNSAIVDIEPTLDGGYIALENVSYPNATTPSFTDTIAMLLKVSNDGTEEWHKEILPNATSSQTAYSLTTTPDSGFLVNFTEFIPGMGRIPSVMKFDSQGDSLWRQSFTSVCCNNIYKINSIVTTDGNYVIAALNYDGIRKVSPQGNVIWSNTTDFVSIYRLEALPNNGIGLLGISINSSFQYVLAELDGQGAVTWEKPITSSGANRFYILKNTFDNELLTIKTNASSSQDIIKFDNSGNSIWSIDLPNSYGELEDIGLTANSNYLIIYEDNNNFYVETLDTTGNSIKVVNLGANLTFSDDAIQSICLDQTGSNLIAGSYLGQSTIWKLGANGDLFSNKIKGQVYLDANSNCIEDNGEIGLKNWIIEAQKNNDSYYALTDSNGYYIVGVDTGIFNVTIHPPLNNNYWNYCQLNQQATFPNFDDSTTLDFGVQALVNCPNLVVDIGTPIIRQCCPNIYTVQYCNFGTQASPNSFVEVKFDDDLIVTTSSIPWSSQNGNTYSFPVGDLGISDCGQFTVTTVIDTAAGVLLGATHCTEAHIFPDTICTVPSNWNGANIIVEGTCLTNSIQFKIKNVGTANMSQQLNYFVIEDDLIMLQNPFLINQGDSVVIDVPTTGSTFRLIAEQEPNHPFSQFPTVVIESCASIGNFSLGFVNIFSNDDGAPFLSIDCTENIGSYDPNDKQGYPLGVGATHNILQNTTIDYKIRFQNTGTDTAFNIVILDTIDTDLLDITSILFGASSHSYVPNINGQGILKFTFANIMLPDSNVNEATSHGFVKFKINQKANNPIGTLIENNAAIYFDNNPPIITNTAFHTVSQFPFLISVNEPESTHLPSVKVFPNPLLERATFYINDEQPRDLQFTVYDVTGRVVFQEKHQQTYSFDFYKNALSSGMYFYTIQEDGKNINQGKIVIR